MYSKIPTSPTVRHRPEVGAGVWTVDTGNQGGDIVPPKNVEVRSPTLSHVLCAHYGTGHGPYPSTSLEKGTE